MCVKMIIKSKRFLKYSWVWSIGRMWWTNLCNLFKLKQFWSGDSWKVAALWETPSITSNETDNHLTSKFNPHYFQNSAMQVALWVSAYFWDNLSPIGWDGYSFSFCLWRNHFYCHLLFKCLFIRQGTGSSFTSFDV